MGSQASKLDVVDGRGITFEELFWLEIPLGKDKGERGQGRKEIVQRIWYENLKKAGSSVAITDCLQGSSAASSDRSVTLAARSSNETASDIQLEAYSV